MRLELKDLSYQYPKCKIRALSELSFQLESGSFWCVAGPNGSGKSTLLKLISGLLTSGIKTGQVLWNEADLELLSRIDLAKSIAFVPGVLRSSAWITVREFVLQGRYAHAPFWKKHTQQDYAIADQALEQVGLKEHHESDISEISSGEAQLMLIARALAQEPKAIILDEATANLDLHYQRRIFELLQQLNSGKKITTLIAIHDLNLAAEFCPFVLWLKEGKVLSKGRFSETLDENLLKKLYGPDCKVSVAPNPFTQNPKVFFTK